MFLSTSLYQQLKYFIMIVIVVLIDPKGIPHRDLPSPKGIPLPCKGFLKFDYTILDCDDGGIMISI